MLISKECFERGCSCYDDRVDKDPVEVVERQWVGLANEEIAAVMHGSVEGERMLPYQFARAIEAKLKAKNT